MATTWSSTNGREKDLIYLQNSSLINDVRININIMRITRTVWTRIN